MAKTQQPVVELFKPRSWNPKVRALVKKLVPSDVIHRLKQMPGEDMYADTMEYLQSAYRAAGYGYDEATSETLAEEVLMRFAFL